MTLRLLRDGTIDPPAMTTMSAIPDPRQVQQAPATVRVSAEPYHVSPPTRQHSKSMPSTPSQRPHPDNSDLRSPSLHRTLHNISPRSLQSDFTNVPSRKPCKFETGMARARRRVPYSLGPDTLPPEPTAAGKTLSPEKEENLSKDMRELYGRLVPTLESEDRRQKFITKLDKILSERWPTSAIKVNVFGSTGNNLGTLTSDVDVCITTDDKELTRICAIAELLAAKGMERVVCVSSAKVPIVKVWDPELQMACDLNVNNPIALENTALIRSYVDIDDRVRPLAMIVKHWAKQRILNDAALGGTLSSYTWICLTLNFLQTLKTPILPSLQSQRGLKPRVLDGVNVSFDADTSKYTSLGASNASSLGELLFQFFRYYAHEFDFDKNVVSVRLGALVPKSTKGWHMLQDNRLCVEEPFNINRNLANTADDTSMRGIHLELRRAFDLIVEGKLDECCEQYEYPAEEVKPSDLFVPPQSRPVIPQPPQPQTPKTTKTSRSRQNNHHIKASVASRRASNPINRHHMHLRNLPFNMTPQELQSQALHQQHLLHDQLFQQYQYLQLQEQELRARLNQQNLRQQHILAQQRGLYGNAEDNIDSATAAAFNLQNRGPLSAPLYQARFGAPSPFMPHAVPIDGVSTNPSSPHLSPRIPDTRRYPRRTSGGQSLASGSLRAQSQPARGLVTSMSMSHLQPTAEVNDSTSSRRSSASNTTHESVPTYGSQRSQLNGSYYDLNRKPAEYVGYFVGQSPSLYSTPQSNSISPIPSQAGLAIQNGGLSPRLTSRSSMASMNGTCSTSPSREPRSRTSSQQSARTLKDKEGPQTPQSETPVRRNGPLVVDGSIHSPRRRRFHSSTVVESDEQITFSGSTSDDPACDTPSSSDDNAAEVEGLPMNLNEKLQTSTGGVVNGYIPGYPQVVAAQENGQDSRRLVNGHGPPSNVKSSLTAWSLPRQLSSVQEVRTPSPGFEMTLPTGRSPTSPRFPEKSSPLAVRETVDMNVTIKPEDGSHQVTNPSSWQMPKPKKHKKKKTVRSENDASPSNVNGGEYLPLDESLRKGG